MQARPSGPPSRRRPVAALTFLAGAALLCPAPLTAAVAFSVGDVIAGVGNGRFHHFSPAGTLLEVLDTTTGSFNTTGMCFDPAGNMYGTTLGGNVVAKFSNVGTLIGPFGGGFSGPESCLIVGGNTMYLSQVSGTGNILKLSLSGAQLASYATARSDWIDLAADGCTMLYSDEGPAIHRINVCTNAPLSDFVNVAGGAFYALRILSDGTVMAASGPTVRRFDSSGLQIASYTAPGETFFFALNVDPDGSHFWSGGILSGIVYKFNIAPVASPVLSFSSQTAPGFQLAGLALVGERLVSRPSAAVPTLSFPMRALLGLALVGSALLALRRL